MWAKAEYVRTAHVAKHVKLTLSGKEFKFQHHQAASVELFKQGAFRLNRSDVYMR